MLPAGFALWVKAAQAWRQHVQASRLSPNGRRRFWQMFTGLAVMLSNRAPAEADFQRLMSDAIGLGGILDQGSVTLVGAGPGDPELVILRAESGRSSTCNRFSDDWMPRFRGA